ncbi:GLPGLI family protein [Sphingobacterium thalpophilum]|uniref:GLPGLI family protein n=1 Tax=Sphingobacterium thalpophilum TaxID=259 RepID=A0A4U9US86_9SPHI|nr:GLPGLI family protein [Sphingobacterium thalpophilum]VTR35119.1 GLPGLI family protein [Sphingobacterium thalpophilum]
MTKHIKLIFWIIGLCTGVAHAQHAYFPSSGTVTYERKFHVQNFLKRNYLNKPDLDTWDKLTVDNAVKNGPVEVVTHHTLKFYDSETLFETVQEDYPASYRNVTRYNAILPDAKTYINFKNQEYLKLLPFGDEQLLLKDSLPAVKWKYTDEYRHIAGYDCRRVNGIIQDSIYAVAFFAGQIPIPGGPELVHGLPGLILGISIPSMNVNMFATKVEISNAPVSNVLTKKKKVVPESKAEITKKLKETVYDWLDESEFRKRLQSVFF